MFFQLWTLLHNTGLFADTEEMDSGSLNAICMYQLS